MRWKFLPSPVKNWKLGMLSGWQTSFPSLLTRKLPKIPPQSFRVLSKENKFSLPRKSKKQQELNKKMYSAFEDERERPPTLKEKWLPRIKHFFFVTFVIGLWLCIHLGLYWTVQQAKTSIKFVDDGPWRQHCPLHFWFAVITIMKRI